MFEAQKRSNYHNVRNKADTREKSAKSIQTFVAELSFLFFSFSPINHLMTPGIY